MLKRAVCSISEKQEICEYRERNMNASQQRVTKHLSAVWKILHRCRRCIGDVLMNAEKCMNTYDLHSNLKGLKTVKHKDLPIAHECTTNEC